MTRQDQIWLNKKLKMNQFLDQYLENFSLDVSSRKHFIVISTRDIIKIEIEAWAKFYK